MDKNYIVTALRQGFSESQIAQGLGVTQSAVSQFISTHGLLEEVRAKSRFMQIDEDLNSAEELILAKLKKSMQFAVMNPLQWGQLLKIVNGAKRRSLDEGRPLVQDGVRLVNIRLPERMRIEVAKNANNEVIEVQGRVLETLPAGKLAEYAGARDPGAIDSRIEELENDSTTGNRLTKKEISELL